MIFDFGISRRVRWDGSITGTSHFKYTMRWIAIELVNPPEETEAGKPPVDIFHTKQSDIWALGMVFYVNDICTCLFQW